MFKNLEKDILKNKICKFFGSIFCEFASRWFFIFDGPWDNKPWTLRNYLAFFIGSIPMIIGCLFYGLVDEVINEMD